MPTRVKLPDGSVGVFPDGMSESEIEGVLQKQYGGGGSSRPAGLPDGIDLPGIPSAPVPDVHNNALDRLMGNGIGDAGSVIGSHLKNLVAGPYHAFADAPRNSEEQNIKGNDVPSALGQFGLGMSRMLVQPTMDSGKKAVQSLKSGDLTGAASNAMDAIPIAGPMARGIENDAQEHGAIPALLGAGVDLLAPEAAGGLLGKIRGAAPSMAEGAMSIRRGDRGYGKTPGRAILDETSGVRPETVGKQAQAVLNQLNPQIDGMAAAHQGTIDITPARQTVTDAIDTARSRNNAIGRDALGPVADQLNTNLDNGLPLSANQTAIGTLNLKRGLRDAFVKNWSPDAASVLTRDTAKGASRQLDNGLDTALGPQFADTNQRISSLIPVTDAAEKLSRADELTQRFGDKLRAHTGALTSALGGAVAGGHSGGLLGAIGGGTLGFALPELLGGPTAKMAIARGMDSPIPGAAIPPLFAGGILAPKKEKK